MIEAKKNRIGDTLLYLLIISIFCFDGDANLNSLVYITAVLFIGYMVMYLMKNRFLNVYYFLSWFPFMMICFISCLWSADPVLSKGRCITLLMNYILFGLMWVYVNDFERIEVLTRGIIMAGGIFAIYIILVYGGLTAFIRTMNNIDSVGRIGEEVAHLSRIGQSLSIAFTLTFYVAFECKEKGKKIVYLLLMVIEIVVILASQSRTALMVAVIGVLISLIFQMKSQSSQHWILAVICIVAVVFIISQFVDFSVLLGRWEGIADIIKGGSGDASANARMDMVHIGLEKFSEKPLLGWGINSSAVISPYRTYFHNNYIEMLATLGGVGFVVFYYVYIKNYFFLIRTRTKDFYTNFSIVLIFVQALLMMSAVSYYVKVHYLIIVYFMATAYRNKMTLIKSQENIMEE